MDRQSLASEENHPSATPKGTEDLEKLQSVIIQNVSHELRTPLAIIQGYAELLHGGDLGALAPDQQEAAVVIVNRAQALRGVVEKLDTLMSIEAQSGVAQPLDLARIVEDVFERRRATCVDTGLEMNLYLESDLPLVKADAHQVEQAVDCLIDNAIKFTPSDGRIDVRLHREQDHVSLEVADTGIGIQDEELDRIFARFYQIDGSTTRQYGGMGLGLAVAKSVVEAYNGQIAVESQTGAGSTFSIRFPALPADAQVARIVEVDVVLRRILIVDDEENVALTLKDGLEKLPNCEIHVATSGQEALTLFEEAPFDLLITDYKMPDIDGVSLATRIQEDYPRTTIIMITAYGDEALRGQATRASIQRVLDKPVRLKEIRNVALEALSKPENGSKKPPE